MLIIEDAPAQVASGTVKLRNAAKNTEITARLNLSERQKEILLAGGLLNAVRKSAD
jgi:aconitate hydratase